ncbi:MAG: hypothetical protein ABR562_02495, partial [Thermoplasmatota archaeon]
MMPASGYDIIACDRYVSPCTTDTNPTAWGQQFGANFPVCDPSQDAAPNCAEGQGLCSTLRDVTEDTVDPAVNGAVG